jgi:hypothetical protein
MARGVLECRRQGNTQRWRPGERLKTPSGSLNRTMLQRPKSLPGKLQSELDLPGSRVRQSKYAGVTDLISGGVHDDSIVVW